MNLHRSCEVRRPIVVFPEIVGEPRVRRGNRDQIAGALVGDVRAALLVLAEDGLDSDDTFQNGRTSLSRRRSFT